MSKLDDLINEALSVQDQEILAGTEEQGWFALGTDVFKGKLGWISWVLMITQTCLFVLGVWLAWQMFSATEVISALQWGFSATVTLLMGGMLKMSLMPQLQANRVLRELKRVELLILHSKKDD
ncbi:MAG: hypothetical protein JKY31_08575 [Rhodobacteraceae bacterium]|nr:hypothetical protein [Paracoccaceae bacterium]